MNSEQRKFHLQNQDLVDKGHQHKFPLDFLEEGETYYISIKFRLTACRTSFGVCDPLVLGIGRAPVEIALQTLVAFEKLHANCVNLVDRLSSSDPGIRLH